MTNAQLITQLAIIKSTADKLRAAVYDAWKKQNPSLSGSSNGSIMTSPKALKGAKAAVNNKYGPGSVTW